MRWRFRPERVGTEHVCTEHVGTEHVGAQPGDAGTVTAEFAVALPAVVLVLACCLGALRIGVEQVRLTDASAAAARMLGRGDATRAAQAAVSAQSDGSIERVSRAGDLVCAEVTSSVRIGQVLDLPLSERACALDDAQAR